MLRPLLASCLLLTCASAQKETTPVGLLKTDGNASSALPWSASSARLQQIDGTVASLGPRLVRQLSFRRDGDPFVMQKSPAREVTLSLLLAHADLSQSGTTFDKNHGAGATVVFDKTVVKLPEWSGRSPTEPAAFDVLLPLPRAWSYDGKADLLWDLAVLANTSTAAALSDAEDARFAGAVLGGRGPGCLVGRVEMRTWSRLDDFGSGRPFEWRAGVLDGPPQALAVLMIGGSEVPPIPLPQPPCHPYADTSRLYLQPLLTLPLGTTGGDGSALAQWRLKWNASYFGFQLRMQGLAADAKMFWGVRLASYGAVVVQSRSREVQTLLRSADSAGAGVATSEMPGGLVVGID